jgi:hypothetical protein
MKREADEPEYDDLAALGLTGLTLTGPDKDRELTVHGNEKLFSAWQASGQPIAEWIAANRSLIDDAGRTIS